MGDQEPVPSHVGGFTIMSGKALRFGVFGADYLGHNNEGLRLLKVLREGEGVVMSEEAYAGLKGNASLLHFEAGQVVSQDQRVLTANTVQASALGVVVSGSPLQNECVETTREFDADQRMAGVLRGMSLVKRAELVREIARILERLHKDSLTFPYITPWNVVVEADQPKLVEVGLGYRPDQPGFSKDRIPEDVLVYLAPEVIKAIGEGSVVQVSPAADVYALAATARSFLLNHVVDPAPLPGPTPPARRELALKGTGVHQAPHQLYSRDLEALLGRALSTDPARRPSAAQLASELDQLIAGEKLGWTPPPQWPKFVGIAAGVVVALVLVIFIWQALQPPSGLVKARQDYAAATRAQDPAERRKLLEGATVEGPDGKPGLIPEAERLLAVDAWRAWVKARQAGAPPPADEKKDDGKKKADEKGEKKEEAPQGPPSGYAAELQRIIEGLETKVAGTYTDDLATTARYLAAFLRRWELGTKESREAAKVTLEALAKADTKPDDLRHLAAATLALTATGVEGKVTEDDLRKWIDPVALSGTEAGALGKTYAPAESISTDPSVLEKPVGTKLDAEWVSKLVGGQLQVALKKHEDARGKLGAARDGASTFATEAAFGLCVAAMANKPEDLELARKSVAKAMAFRPFAEGLLALGRADLAAAHAQPTAEAYKKAAVGLQQASGAAADTPGLDPKAAAGALELEARFYEAVTLALDPAQADAAEAALEQLLKGLDGAPEAADRFGPDARIARGLVKAGRGDAGMAAAKPDLLALFKNGDPSQGDAELPALTPLPGTRAAAKAKALGSLMAAYLQDVENVPEPPTREWVTKADQSMKALEALAAAPGAAVEAVRILLARAGIELARARSFDGVTGERALDAARTAYTQALEKLDPAKQPDSWLKALRGKLEVLVAQAERMGTGAEVEKALEPPTRTLADLNAAGQTIPRTLTKEWEKFQPKMLERIRGALFARVQAYIDERRPIWNRLDPAQPKAESSDEQLATDLKVLSQAVAALGDPPPDAEKFRAAQLWFYLGLAHRSKGGANGSVFDACEQATKLLDGLSEEESKHTDLKKNVNYLIGVVALKEPESLKSKLRDPRQYALDALSRACGARDFAGLKEMVKKGQTPVGPPGRETQPAAALANDIVARYDSETTIPKDPLYGKPEGIPNAQTIEAELSFATNMDRNNFRALLLLARVQFALGQDKVDACAANALAAFTHARGAQGENTAALQVTVQAARLFCYAKFMRAGPAGFNDVGRGEEFKRVAQGGREAAQRLIEREPAQTAQRYNFGPAYWYARSLLEEAQFLRKANKPKPEQKPAFEQAKQAYEQFRALVEPQGQPKRDLPAEATGWVGEYRNIVSIIGTL
jgi:hypothetical protein